MKKQCDYCKSDDGKVSEYCPGTCAHCGAPITTVIVYGFYYGKAVTNADEWDRLINESGVLHLPFRMESLRG